MIQVLSGRITRQDWAFVGIVLTITALFFVGFYFLGYRTMQDTIGQRTEALENTRAELKKARQLVEGIEELREEAREMERLVEVFEKRLPEEREIPALLSRFELLGGEIGLRVQLSSLQTRKIRNTEIIPYKVVAFGQFHQIITFINMLERDERYLKVTDLDIGEENNGVSQATFVLSTFRFISEPDAKE